MIVLFATAMIKLGCTGLVLNLVGRGIAAVVEAHRVEREVMAELEAADARR